MQTDMHRNHIAARKSYNSCPECRADNSRRFAVNRPFRYQYVREYLSYVRPRLEALRTGQNGGDTVAARQWYRYDFMPALHNRINSHIPGQTGRKYASDYAKYHLATYGSDWHYLNA